MHDVDYSGLTEVWSTLAGDNLPLLEGAEEVINKAYSVEVDPEQRALRISFAYDHDEVYAAFKDGADVVGMFAPDVFNTTCTYMGDGYIIYVDMSWEEDGDGDDDDDDNEY
jgi:hypothetical protein